MPEMKAVCVFCGSRAGDLPEYAEAARSMGALLARQGKTVVYGGGRVGMMGEMADAALEAGGKVVGIIPDFLKAREVGHMEITELIVVSSMHERKMKLAGMSDGFIAMPGGIGTMDEVCEILTWRQLGLHQKPVAFLNTEGYYDKFLDWFEFMAKEGFYSENHLNQLIVSDDPEELIRLMESFEPMSESLHMRPEQT